MILAWLIAFFLSFTIALGTAHGLGRYDVDIPEDQRAVLRRCEYVFSILYVSEELGWWRHTLSRYQQY